MPKGGINMYREEEEYIHWALWGQNDALELQ